MCDDPRMGIPAISALKRLARDRHGATAIEYALIITFIATVIVGGATALGTKVNASLGRAAAGFDGATAS